MGNKNIMIDIDDDISLKELSGLLGKLGYNSDLSGIENKDFPLNNNDGSIVKKEEKYIAKGIYVYSTEEGLDWTDQYDIDDAALEGEKEQIQSLSELKSIGKFSKELTTTHDEKFYYMLLDRLRSDCEYYLGNGNGYAKHLWAGDEKDQINIMKYLYMKVPKPEWISMKEIETLGKRMENFKRISDVQVISSNDGRLSIRCKIDGEQQFSVKMSKEDTIFFDKAFHTTDKQMAEKYFSDELNQPKQEQQQGMKR